MILGNTKQHFETSHQRHRKHKPQNNQPEFFLSEHNGALSVAASIAAGLGLQRRRQLPPGVPL